MNNLFIESLCIGITYTIYSNIFIKLLFDLKYNNRFNLIQTYNNLNKYYIIDLCILKLIMIIYILKNYFN